MRSVVINENPIIVTTSTQKGLLLSKIPSNPVLPLAFVTLTHAIVLQAQANAEKTTQVALREDATLICREPSCRIRMEGPIREPTHIKCCKNWFCR